MSNKDKSKMPGRLLVAGTGSGVGKTSITLGLIRALRNRGLIVQPFKAGPDFLDPTYLSLAAGRTCYNLDGWMSGRAYVESLFREKSADADIAIVEGAMGLFDGADPKTAEGSAAELAVWLNLPTLLVVNAHGMAGSIAPIVKGFAEFDAKVKLAGVVANQCGSENHRRMLAESLAAASLPTLFGAITRGGMAELKSRHLGLETADDQTLPEETIEKLARACQEYLDIDAIIAVARSTAAVAGEVAVSSPQARGGAIKLAVADDKALHFAYPDNFEALASAGAEIVHFSPLADDALPAGIDAIYLPGGYPEVFAAELSRNKTMLQSIRDFVASGRHLYAECGGLMYLGDAIRTADGVDVPMCGVLPVTTQMSGRLKMLGYVEVTMRDDTAWACAGQKIRGHEFHYSQIVDDDLQSQGWRRVFDVEYRRGAKPAAEGFAKGNVLATYIHMHWASRADLCRRFVQRCKESI